MVHVTAILLNGANIDTWPKLKIIIGKVNTNADKVKVNAVFISNILGKNENVFSKNFWVYIIHKTAKKLKWNDIS